MTDYGAVHVARVELIIIIVNLFFFKLFTLQKCSPSTVEAVTILARCTIDLIATLV